MSLSRTRENRGGRLHRRAAVVISVLALGLIAACVGPTGGSGREPTPVFTDPDKVHVVATFSLIADIVREIGGDLVEVYSMVPMGTDPHEYQPLPDDIRAATEADLLIWNGLDMETGDGWFARLVEVSGKSPEQVVAAADAIEPEWLTDGTEVEKNPHAFVSPVAGIAYAVAITDALAIVVEHADEIRTTGGHYQDRLVAVTDEYADRLGRIPAEQRVLITSERAFQYLATDYGLQEGYLWQIDTEEQGTPKQITGLIEFIRSRNVAGVLVESNVDPRPMGIVAEEVGLDVVGTVYSDELGAAGSPAETYLDYLGCNLEVIARAMGG